MELPFCLVSKNLKEDEERDLEHFLRRNLPGKIPKRL